MAFLEATISFLVSNLKLTNKANFFLKKAFNSPKIQAPHFIE